MDEEDAGLWRNRGYKGKSANDVASVTCVYYTERVLILTSLY